MVGRRCLNLPMTTGGAVLLIADVTSVEDEISMSPTGATAAGSAIAHASFVADLQLTGITLRILMSIMI